MIDEDMDWRKYNVDRSPPYSSKFVVITEFNYSIVRLYIDELVLI